MGRVSVFSVKIMFRCLFFWVQGMERISELVVGRLSSCWIRSGSNAEGCMSGSWWSAWRGGFAIVEWIERQLVGCLSQTQLLLYILRQFVVVKPLFKVYIFVSGECLGWHNHILKQVHTGSWVLPSIHAGCFGRYAVYEVIKIGYIRRVECLPHNT